MPACSCEVGQTLATEKMRFLVQLLSSDFLPHGTCYLWNPKILWLHVISDGIITLSYYCIPLALIYLLRRRKDLPFNWIFWMFGMFILGCGTTSRNFFCGGLDRHAAREHHDRQNHRAD